MGGATVEKKTDHLMDDMQVMYYKVKRANETHSLISRKGLEEDVTFEDEKGKWGRDKVRFNAAFDALIKGGYIKERDEKVKVGMLKSEHALEAVKLPGEAPKGIRSDIENFRKGHEG